MVVTGPAGHCVIAVARTDDVVAPSGANIEPLNARKINAIIVMRVVGEIGTGVSRSQRSSQR